jgi:hypothetical protein
MQDPFICPRCGLGHFLESVVGDISGWKCPTCESIWPADTIMLRHRKADIRELDKKTLCELFLSTFCASLAFCCDENEDINVMDFGGAGLVELKDKPATTGVALLSFVFSARLAHAEAFIDQIQDKLNSVICGVVENINEGSKDA